MRLLNFLSGIAPVLLCLAAPDEKGSGGTTDPQPEQPQGDTPELKYSSALKIIGDYFKQLSGAMREKDEAIGQVAGLTARAEKAEKERDEHKVSLDSANSQLSTLNSQLLGVTKERDDSRSRVTLIESFCKHSNVDLAGLEKFKAAKTTAELAPGGAADEGKAHYDKWQALKKTDSKKAAAYFKQHKAAIKDYVDSTEE
jgi:hypothetical protein